MTRSVFFLTRMLMAGTVVTTSLQTLAQTPNIDLAHLKALGTIDERFQSYNVEMLEVTGGNFGSVTENSSRAAGAIGIVWAKTSNDAVKRIVGPAEIQSLMAPF